MINRRGFTLFELLISMAVGSLIAMAALVTLTDFLRIRSKAEFSNQLIASSELIFTFLTEDVHNSQSAQLDNEMITLVTFDDEVITYRRDPNSNRILRNGNPITAQEIEVAQFEIASRAPDGSLGLYEFRVELVYDDTTSDPVNVTKQTTISLRSNRGSHL